MRTIDEAAKSYTFLIDQLGEEQARHLLVKEVNNNVSEEVSLRDIAYAVDEFIAAVEEQL